MQAMSEATGKLAVINGLIPGSQHLYPVLSPVKISRLEWQNMSWMLPERTMDFRIGSPRMHTQEPPWRLLLQDGFGSALPSGQKVKGGPNEEIRACSPE